MASRPMAGRPKRSRLCLLPRSGEFRQRSFGITGRIPGAVTEVGCNEVVFRPEYPNVDEQAGCVSIGDEACGCGQASVRPVDD